MKKIMNTMAAAAALTMVLVGCTSEFEEYNTNPDGPTPEQMEADNAATSSLVRTSLTTLCQMQQNAVQDIEQLVGGDYGGMMAPNQSWNNYADGFTNFDINVIGTHNATLFDMTMPAFYTPYFKVRDISNGEGVVFHWMNIIRVGAMIRVSDTYGPIPYSKITGDSFSTPYDDMPELYQAMLADLDAAIDYLTPIASTEPVIASLKDADAVYGGNFNKWVKFANTLKLRLAVRMAEVDGTLAQKIAEEAANHPIGTTSDVSDRAESNDHDQSMNGFYRISHNWNSGDGEVRISNNITCYMNGYNDPRISKYAEQSATGDYNGIPHGLAKGNRDPYKAASNLNISQSDPMLIMSAAESYFLKAECAVRGWNMGNSAQNLYEQGIKVSMQEHGVEIGNYLEGTTAPASYSDNIGSNSQSNPSSITVKWNEGDSNDQKYERILVQKWLANFPNGWETWTDRRRTGYPRFFRPVTTMGSSAGLSDIMRRLPYPESEYLTNSENVAAAVQMIGGSDSYGTKLWWVTQ